MNHKSTSTYRTLCLVLGYRFNHNETEVDSYVKHRNLHLQDFLVRLFKGQGLVKLQGLYSFEGVTPGTCLVRSGIFHLKVWAIQVNSK